MQESTVIYLLFAVKGLLTALLLHHVGTDVVVLVLDIEVVVDKIIRERGRDRTGSICYSAQYRRRELVKVLLFVISYWTVFVRHI